MDDYISREAAIREVGVSTWAGARLKDLPAADVRPVVHGKWEWDEHHGNYYCPNCKAVSPIEDQSGEYISRPNFCPNCGAIMDENLSLKRATGEDNGNAAQDTLISAT